MKRDPRKYFTDLKARYPFADEKCFEALGQSLSSRLPLAIIEDGKIYTATKLPAKMQGYIEGFMIGLMWAGYEAD